MPAKITLTVVQGPLQDQQFVFDERTTCIMGRHRECQPRLPDDDAHNTISRHHCLLDINPPDIRIRDFGSLNGTFINDTEIGRRRKGQRPREVDRSKFSEHDLQDGDAIRLGGTVFRIAIFVPTPCAAAGCTNEVPEDRKAELERSPGVYLCPGCSCKTKSLVPLKSGYHCPICGQDVTEEAGQTRQGDYVCDACKANPLALILRMLDMEALQGYRILRGLGQGGMGAVYLARHEQSGEEVALKVMLPRVAVQPRARDQFLREAAITRMLKHPNIVELRHAGCSEGAFFFTLEFCAGGSVEDLRKKRGGCLEIDEAVPILLQVLDGLEHAHNAAVEVRLADGSMAQSNGVVHRDLKPPNIFLTADCRMAKVGDYGLAKAFDLAGLSGQSRTGAFAGSPWFMPRQQVVNFKYARPEVDVWAAAASLYFLLTGVPPRDFPADRDWWQVVVDTPAVPIRRRGVPIPPKLADVIDHALRDKPDIGFKTATELEHALQEAV